MYQKNSEGDEPLYMISVAARMVNLHPQTLRHYEKIGLIEPSRSPGGTRMYSPRNIQKLKKITGLIENLGVNLAGVEVILKMSKQIEELQRKIKTIEAEYQDEINKMRQTFIEDQSLHRLRLPKPTSK